MTVPSMPGCSVHLNGNTPTVANTRDTVTLRVVLMSAESNRPLVRGRVLGVRDRG